MAGYHRKTILFVAALVGLAVSIAIAFALPLLLHDLVAPRANSPEGALALAQMISIPVGVIIGGVLAGLMIGERPPNRISEVVVTPGLHFSIVFFGAALVGIAPPLSLLVLAALLTLLFLVSWLSVHLGKTFAHPFLKRHIDLS
jgi:hypothetical protein